MNRIEIIGLFTAMDRMFETGDSEGVRLIVKEVLNEAKTKKPVNSKEESEEQK